MKKEIYEKGLKLAQEIFDLSKKKIDLDLDVGNLVTERELFLGNMTLNINFELDEEGKPKYRNETVRECETRKRVSEDIGYVELINSLKEKIRERNRLDTAIQLKQNELKMTKSYLDTFIKEI